MKAIIKIKYGGELVCNLKKMNEDRRIAFNLDLIS